MVDRHHIIPEVVYHYCSVQSFHAIVESRRFRLSNVLFMNDSMELTWLRQVFESVLNENISLVGDDYRRSVTSALAIRRFEHVYCGCFSATVDDLSQWRGYADDGRGVALGVDLKAIAEGMPMASMQIAPVEYDESKQREFALSLLQEASNELNRTERSDDRKKRVAERAFLTYMGLCMSAPLYKNPAFSNEAEIRLVSAAHMMASTTTDEWRGENLFLPSDVNFTSHNGTLIPFVHVDLPPEAIKQVWFGPRFGAGAERDSVRLFLSKHKVDAGLQNSSASYR